MLTINPLHLPIKTDLFTDYDFNVKRYEMYDVIIIIHECCSYLMSRYTGW